MPVVARYGFSVGGTTSDAAKRTAATRRTASPRTRTASTDGASTWLFGGYAEADGERTVVNDLYRLDATETGWTRVRESADGADVPGPRLATASAVLDGEMLLFGGWDPQVRVNPSPNPSRSPSPSRSPNPSPDPNPHPSQVDALGALQAALPTLVVPESAVVVTALLGERGQARGVF